MYFVQKNIYAQEPKNEAILRLKLQKMPTGSCSQPVVVPACQSASLPVWLAPTTMYSSTVHTELAADSTLHAVDWAQYTVHCTLYTVDCTLWTVHCTLYTVHCTLYTVDCIHFGLYTVHCTMYTLYSTLYTIHCTLYIVYCTLYMVHYTQYTVHCIQYTWHCTLHIATPYRGTVHTELAVDWLLYKISLQHISYPSDCPPLVGTTILTKLISIK